MLRLVLKNGGVTWVQGTSLSKLDLFKKRPELLKRNAYEVKSDVSLEVLNVFLARVLEDSSNSNVTKENAASLQLLCQEFGFREFDDEISKILGGTETRMSREFLELKARVARHDIIIEQLQRQVRDLECQRKAWEAAHERMPDDNRPQCHMDTPPVKVCDKVQARKVMPQQTRAKAVKAYATPLPPLKNEVTALKQSEARVNREPASRGQIVRALSAIRNTCLFAVMREQEQIFGRRLVQVKVFGRDLYGMLDPESSDCYRSKNEAGAWIEIEFKEPVRINGLMVDSPKTGENCPRTFDVTFADWIGAPEKYKVSFVDDSRLDGPGGSAKEEFDVVTAKVVRIKSRGPNWDGYGTLEIGSFELFSPTRSDQAVSFAPSSCEIDLTFGTCLMFVRATTMDASFTSQTRGYRF